MQITREDVRKLVLKAARDNYEDPRGLFYSLYQEIEIPFDQLSDQERSTLIDLTGQHLLQGDIDTRLDEYNNKILWQMADESIPSDIIIFKDSKDSDKFRTFWKNPDKKYIGTPSDLFYAGTIPLKDFIIKFKIFSDEQLEEFHSEYTAEQVALLKNLEDEVIVRIVVFENYQEKIQSMVENENIINTVVGMIILDSIGKKKKDKIRIGLPFFASERNDQILFQSIAYDGTSRKDINPENIFSIQEDMTHFLDIWYGIQLALLNPVTEQIFQRARENPISTKKNKVGKGKHRKVVYTKKYVIRAEDIDKTYEERRKNNMSCPLWYVVGHWREYKNGQRIFIKGYWKGPERGRFMNKTMDSEMIDQITSLTRERKVIMSYN